MHTLCVTQSKFKYLHVTGFITRNNSFITLSIISQGGGRGVILPMVVVELAIYSHLSTHATPNLSQQFDRAPGCLQTLIKSI